MNSRGWSVVVVAALFAVGCGSGGHDEAVTVEPTTTTTEETTTTRPPTTTSRPRPSTTTTTAAPERLEPHDPALLDCDGSSITVRTADPADVERIRVVHQMDMESALTRLGLSGGAQDCSSREEFNQDFSMAGLTASPVDGGGNHIVVLDLAKGTAVDLTEPRRGDGFSSGGPMDEYFVSFEPVSPDAAVYTNRVLVGSGSDLVLLDPAQPGWERILPYDESTGRYGPYDRDELESVGSGNDYNDFHHGRTILSPDGRFNISGSGGAYLGAAFDTVNRADLPYECSGMPEGWFDARTVVVAGNANNFYLVPVDDAGNPGACTPILPASDREIVDSRLRLDGKALWVTVTGTNGDETYLADLTKPGAEPERRLGIPAFDPDWRVYFPRTV